MSSIRGKISFGYFGMALCVATFAAFVYGDLHYLERQIDRDFATTALLERVQELRRHEKNFLLYRSSDDLDATTVLVDELVEILGQAAFDGSLAKAERQALADGLKKYRDLVAAYRGDAIRGVKRFEGPLRTAGHDLSEQATRIAQRERAQLARTLGAAQRALVWSMVVVALLGVFGAWMLARAVLAPLRRMEASLKSLAQGRLERLPAVSRDRELMSFTEALNRSIEESTMRRRQLAQSEKLASIGVLASGVAHELNNPLSNISVASQILIEDDKSLDVAARRQWLEQIDEETERARRIVRTLLDYSRRRDFKRETVGLGGVVEKALLLHGRPDGQWRIDVDIPSHLKVYADAQRLQQVFINLIRNAVASGGEGVGIRIAAGPAGAGEWPPSLHAYVVGAPRHGVPGALIRVADDGPGIAPENLSRVFDPFFTTRAPGQGEGLGLYVVEEIVLEHEGAIAAENLADGGACFTLWLPRRGESA